MKTSKKGIDLIKSFEGLKLKPYLCSAGVPTIGYGNTMYPNGKKVTLKDAPITQAEAEKMLLFTLRLFEKDVNLLTKNVNLTQNQFDALVCFSYNLGTDIDADNIPEGLGDSTLLKKVRINPNDPTIRNEFLKWNKANGKVLAGLTRRRQSEAGLYFSLDFF